MKDYKISYIKQKYGTVTVKAASLQEAEEMALKASMGNTLNESYIEGSFELDYEVNEDQNEE